MASNPSSAFSIVSISIRTTIETYTQTLPEYTTQSIVTHTAAPSIVISNDMTMTRYYKSWGLEDIVLAPVTQTFTVSSVITTSVMVSISTSTPLEASVNKKTDSLAQTTTSLPTSVTSSILSTSGFQSKVAANSSISDVIYPTSASYLPPSILVASPLSSTSSRTPATGLTTSSAEQANQTSTSPSRIVLGSILGGFAFICLFIIVFHLLRLKIRRWRHASSPSITDDEAKFSEPNDEKHRNEEGKIESHGYEAEYYTLAELAAEKEEGDYTLGKLAELA
ncbi:hypothetical protein MFRU_045g00700 [Monilinia fructicola]|uniref:Mid2 domain-containing protein n=1 Tax=Monilinia fructicola TaxID=38448 RepID=A0A5M9JAL8_MONFR|nr:hypothetical protein EYC84_011090 [Monilinia fructicola]KAG4026125.1 hypothetical protein MFRU_045g00700 [Monilinia fructicola]